MAKANKTLREVAEEKHARPAQGQDFQPGRTAPMMPPPEDRMERYKSAKRFEGKSVVITGGDSGIGRAAAIGFAKEGANVTVVYLNEDDDALLTKDLIEKEGVKALLMRGDVGSENFCKKVAKKTVERFGRIDVLVNNAAEQHPQETIEDIDEKQLEKTFRTNVFSLFFMTKACISCLPKGGSIVNVASITAYEGSPKLLDYSSTKGAIVAFTRSLAQSLVEKKIRVNAVAPGPIWTPLIPSTFPPEKVKSFGSDVPMKRAGQPDEVAPSIIFLASDDATYISGQTIHPNGGTVVNG